ncbi:MAG: UbiH/UbiF/VisC/COQ6 family ubiquinone biosynthesis hydroxylase [Woeseia sp.]
MNRTFDILIAGAGIAGLTAAALLARSGQGDRFNICVIDAGTRPRFDTDNDVALRVSAIAAGSSRLYSKLGAWDRVAAARASPFREMRVWDASRSLDGPEALHFDAAEFALPELGFIVENVLLQDALLQVLDAAGVALRFETQIEALQVASRGGVDVECADGEMLHADLVIGADGASSSIRQQAKIALTSWRYPQSAFVMHLRPEREHRECAWQRFLPTGPLALLPLQDGRVSVVWSTTPELAEEACAATDAELGAMLTEASGRALGQLNAAGSRGTFPLKAQYAVRYVTPGTALIGDAAHSIHPLAGQGANLGIADAAVLARVIGDAVAAGEHPGDLPVLRRYERARKGANKTMLYFVDTLNRLFSSPSSGASAMRGAGMRMFNLSGPVRKRAVAVALGLQHGT